MTAPRYLVTQPRYVAGLRPSCAHCVHTAQKHKDPLGLVEMVSPFRPASVGTDVALWASDEAADHSRGAPGSRKSRRPKLLKEMLMRRHRIASIAACAFALITFAGC